MDNKISLKLPEDFSLEKFARTYVEEALITAERKPARNQFYRDISVSVAWKLGISPDAVDYLSHPFHWEFFCNRNGDSIFDYQEGRAPGSMGRVTLRRGYTEADIEKITDDVINGDGGRHYGKGLYFKSSFEGTNGHPHTYRELFQARIHRLSGSNGRYDPISQLRFLDLNRGVQVRP
jgi:hypothetical protein